MKKSYQDLKAELDKVVAELQDPETDIDEALELHKTGQKLIAELKTYLSAVGESVAKES